VACRLTPADGLTRDQKIANCVTACLANAHIVLVEAQSDAETACPIACQL
jgi:hypothetical protein